MLRKEQVVRMKQVEHTNSERAVLEVIRHPFLINLWGTFSDPTFLYMVMDFVPGGELFTLLRKSQRFPHPVAKFYAAEVALAIDYLHQNGFVYRDLKPENILLSADGHLKITDFGFAKYVPDVTWTLCGECWRMRPESCVGPSAECTQLTQRGRHAGLSRARDCLVEGLQQVGRLVGAGCAAVRDARECASSAMRCVLALTQSAGWPPAVLHRGRQPDQAVREDHRVQGPLPAVL